MSFSLTLWTCCRYQVHRSLVEYYSGMWPDHHKYLFKEDTMKKVFKRLLAAYFKARRDKWMRTASNSQLEEYMSLLNATKLLVEEQLQARYATESVQVANRGGDNYVRQERQF